MAVDVKTEIVIERPRGDVAAYALDPDNATSWYTHIKAVERNPAQPVGVGSRIVFVAYFLGRRLDYIYEVTALEPGERFQMRTSDGPFPMETTYAWEDTETGATRMLLRNRGEPRGFSRISSLLLRRAMRRANRKDLRRLKELLEAR